ncbi:MAG TPA: hypothetical protein VK829_02385, partial [Terriglobales bacterium]|nr:hypothetical protein [Terriglobales bacterium]
MRESTDFFIKNPSAIFRKAASFYNNYCRRMKAWELRVVDELEFLLWRGADNSPGAVQPFAV